MFTGDSNGIKWANEKAATTTYTSHYPTTAGTTTPMKIDWAPLAELTAPQNIEKMPTEGDFPRPEESTLARNSGPNGEVRVYFYLCMGNSIDGVVIQSTGGALWDGTKRQVGDGVRGRGETRRGP